MKNDNKSNELVPNLVKNPEKNEGSYINVAPMFDGIEFIGSENDPNPMVRMGEFLGNVARVISTSSLDGGMIIDGYTKEEMVYCLFNLENGFKKCTIINC